LPEKLVKIPWAGRGFCSKKELSTETKFFQNEQGRKIMSIIWQLLVGLIIGAIARLLIPGREAISGGFLGLLITALIGMAGAALGTFIARSLWRGDDYTAGWIMSILGAVLLLLLYRFIAARVGRTTAT
jgi:uncharacterized membrane protein YeaQ/YmgE (transglycosylase-associated protein family)